MNMPLSNAEKIIIFVILAIIATILSPSLLSKLDATRSAQVGIQFESNLIPLEVYVNSRGEISLGVSGPRVPTLIGTFTIHADVSFPGRNTLTVIAGNRKHVYDLLDQRFRVSIPNDRNGKSRVEYDGQGNIIIIIPEPIISTSDSSVAADCIEASAIQTWAEASTEGVTVHAKFSVWNAMNKNGYIAAYFSSRDGSPLRDLNGRFKSRGGRVSMGSEFISPYESARYNDFTLHIPSNELHLAPGIHWLRYSVHVFCMEPFSQVAASGEGVVKVEIQNLGRWPQ